MKVLGIVYSFVLVIYGAVVILLSIGSSHNLDNALIISNWGMAISFPLTIYFLNKYFKNHKHLSFIFLMLLINSIIFLFCTYDIILNNDDGLQDAMMELFMPVIGLLLSVFFTIQFLVLIFKAKSLKL